MRKTTMLTNGSRAEAYEKFEEVRKTITDFKKESVSINGNLRNSKDGWSVVKIYL